MRCRGSEPLSATHRSQYRLHRTTQLLLQNSSQWVCASRRGIAPIFRTKPEAEVYIRSACSTPRSTTRQWPPIQALRYLCGSVVCPHGPDLSAEVRELEPPCRPRFE